MAASARSCRGAAGCERLDESGQPRGPGAPRGRAPRSSRRRARRPVRAGASPRRGSSRTRRSANGRRGRRGAPGPRLGRYATPSARASSRGRDSSGASSKPTRATDEGAPWSRVGRVCSAASAASWRRRGRGGPPARAVCRGSRPRRRCAAGWKPRWKGMMVSSSAGPDSEIFGMHRASPPPGARRQARRLACGRAPLAPRRCGSRAPWPSGCCRVRRVLPSDPLRPRAAPFSAPDACAPTRGRSRSWPAGRPRAAGRGPRDRHACPPRAGGAAALCLRRHRPSAAGHAALSRDGRDGRTRTPWPASQAMKRSVSSKKALIAHEMTTASSAAPTTGRIASGSRSIGDAT